jgi:PAS domain S-box-containing protein
VAPALIVGAAYVAAAELGLRFALVADNVTPLWAPTGIAVVGVLWFGRRVLPGVVVAAFLVNLPISTTALAAGGTAVGNTLGPFLAAEALRRFGFRQELDRIRDAVAIIVAALGGGVVSATIGAGILLWSGAIASGDFPTAWTVWWAGDAMGILVVAPFLLSLRRRDGIAMTPARWLEVLALAAAVGGAFVLLVRTSAPLLFLLVPLVGLAAWRFQQRGAAPAALAAASLASWAASRDLGVLGMGSILRRMLVLQAFNATIALTSFFFAAVVSERLRAKETLEERVRERTEELEQREHQLAEAQQVASIGSWEWRIAENVVTWSDEMYRIHGQPRSYELSLETAMELIEEEDRPPIQANLRRAMKRGRDADVPRVEYRIKRPDGEERTLIGHGRIQYRDGTAERIVGTVQDVTDTRRAEHEHRVAETLQRTLLPAELPQIPGVSLAFRYIPATADLEVGGDWYDVIRLPNGLVAAAIGDVAGHGLSAASTMGQLRMALRAYAFSTESPAKVVQATHRMMHRVADTEMATLIYLVLNPDTGEVRFSNAGHPPPLLVEPDGKATFVRGGLAPPLGAMLLPESYIEETVTVPPGSTLLLYTDGLIERRGVSLDDGLDRLRALAEKHGPEAEPLSERLVTEMVGDQVADDVALLLIQMVPLGPGPVALSMPAEPGVLAPLRHTLRRWLRESGASAEETHDILLAVGEACTNAIQHAYGGREGTLDVELTMEGDVAGVTIGDHGTWRRRSGEAGDEGGHGLMLMEQLMEADVERSEGGTRVRLSRRLHGSAPA